MEAAVGVGMEAGIGASTEVSTGSTGVSIEALVAVIMGSITTITTIIATAGRGAGVGAEDDTTTD